MHVLPSTTVGPRAQPRSVPLQKHGFFGLSLPALGVALLVVALLGTAPQAYAYSTVSNCAGCHTFGNSSSTFHLGHLNLGLPAGCTTCHAQVGDTPATPKCGVCHTQPGLPLHHDTTGAASCTGCHSGTPAPENTPVSGYAGLTEALDPCDGSEERFASFSVSLDNDGDGLYDANDPDCAPPANPNDIDNDGDGFTENHGDCNDNDPSIHPGATDICGDNIDQDCSGTDTLCMPADSDADGFDVTTDCNDNDPSIHPGAAEVCDNGIDENCDPTDDICAGSEDADLDGFSPNQGDCNDMNPAVYPGATEVCGNGIDENCNTADDVCPDVDNDGFSTADGDCNDMSAAVHPGAAEVCGNGVDENCDPADDLCQTSVDSDGDGFDATEDCNDADAAIHPGATEIVGNGIDENCNGMADDKEPTTGACTDPEFSVQRAVYNETKHKLAIRGTAGSSSALKVTDAEHGTVLGGRVVDAGTWRLVVKHLDDAPDTVLVESDSGCNAEMDVRRRKQKAEREDDEGTEETPAQHPFGWDNPKEQHRDVVEESGVEACLACHSIDPADKGQAMSCYRCHGQKWEEPKGEPQPVPTVEEPDTHEFGWTDPAREHRDQVEDIGVDVCAVCHSTDPASEGRPMSCFNCHENLWDEGDAEPPVVEPAGHPFGWDNPKSAHPDYVEDHGVIECRTCHSTDPARQGQAMSCFNCHGNRWDNAGGEPPVEPPAGHPFGWDNPKSAHPDYVEDHGVAECRTCHSTDPARQGQAMSCFNCHGREW